MEEEGKMRIEKVWPSLKKVVNKFINLIDEGCVELHNLSFSIQDYMSIYTSVNELSGDGNKNKNSKLLLWDNYKKLFSKYINSKVLPSLRAKENEVLLKELLKKWSNHKIITCWLSRLFRSLETYDITKFMEYSLEEIGFLSFYDLVCKEMNKQVMDVILAMIDDDRAGKHVDRKLINNILNVYMEIGDKTGKNDAKYLTKNFIKENATLFSDDEALNGIAILSLTDNAPKEEKSKSLKKIKLMSYDGDVFEIEYDVALMSKTLQDVIESYPNIGDIEDSIPLSTSVMSSKILGKTIEYCKKHNEKFNMSDSDDEKEHHLMMEDWNAKFIDVDREFLFDLLLSSMYLDIKSLRDLACDKIANMIKGNNLQEMRQFFGSPDVYS